MSPVQKAVAHALFAPSASGRWIPCPGSMTFPENRATDGESSTYADEGTAAHELAARCLKSGKDASVWLHTVIAVNGRDYEVTEDFADAVQVYLDDVRARAAGGQLLVEQRVDLSEWLGPDQGGTSDAVIAMPIEYRVTIEDLKFGRGEKVYAWSMATEASRFTLDMMQPASEEAPGQPVAVKVEPNFQLMLYGLGSLPLVELLMDRIDWVTLVIAQPRIDSIQELTVSMADMLRFAEFVRTAIDDCNQAMTLKPNSADHMFYLKAGEKQCRWCRAKAYCKKLETHVAEEVRMEFEEVAGDGLPARPAVPEDSEALGRAYNALPLIQVWMSAVAERVNQLVGEGVSVIGPDGKPYKFVEGKAGNRTWRNAKDAEAALVGQLPEDKAYSPRKIITPSQAAKLLDRKATKQAWKDMFEPLIFRPQGKPVLTLGSDSRPPYTKAADAGEFEEVGTDDEE